MRPSVAVTLLLLLSFLFHEAKGIRVEKGFMKVGHQKIHGEEKSSLIKRSTGGIGDVILCKEGHSTGIINKKLTTVTASTTTTTSTTSSSKNEENGGRNEANSIPMTSSNGEVGKEHEKFIINSSTTSEDSDHNVDIMDYSPAKRKPPIHN